MDPNPKDSWWFLWVGWKHTEAADIDLKLLDVGDEWCCVVPKGLCGILLRFSEKKEGDVEIFRWGPCDFCRGEEGRLGHSGGKIGKILMDPHVEFDGKKEPVAGL